MKSIIYHHFEDLKKQFLAETDISHIGPYECKKLSACIEEKLNKKVSETTIKRIYGFAKSRFTPSLFTLDVMSQFCGFDGWMDFCDKRKINLEIPNCDDINTSQFVKKN
jgi:hypothetical protein